MNGGGNKMNQILEKFQPEKLYTKNRKEKAKEKLLVKEIRKDL